MENVVFVGVGLFVVAVVLFVYLVCSHKIAGVGQAYVYGNRVITNKGGFVFLPSARRVLDLAVRPITTSVRPVTTEDSEQVTVTLDADVAVLGDDDSIRTAAKHFAGAEHTIDAVAGEVLENAATLITRKSTPEQRNDRVAFAERVRNRANPGLAKLGLTLEVVAVASLVTTPSSLLTTPDELIAR